MAQYDLLLTQNVASTGVEFSEQYVNVAKGSLLSANVTKAPLVLAVGADTQVLIADSTATSGLKWGVPVNSHVQNTDTGTTQTIFHIDSAGSAIELTAESASKFGVKVSGGATYADIQANNATFNKVTLPSSDPVGAYDATSKTYVDNKFGTLAGALLFKGNIMTTGGDITPTAFNALATYNVGWQYRAGEAGTFRGVVCEIGDLLTAIVTRSGSGATNADWTVSQVNIDGAVTGPASATGDNISTFNGASGKIIKDSGIAIGAIATAQTTANNAIPKSTLTGANQLLIGTASSTPSVIQATASTIIGMAAAGNVTALTGAQVLTILGIAGQTVATGAEVDTGTDNVKYVSPKAIADSKQVSYSGSVTASRIAIFGATGKTIQDGGKLLSDLAQWTTAPATKTSTGTVGQIAQDGNFFYSCTATNVWKRSAIATNW